MANLIAAARSAWFAASLLPPNLNRLLGCSINHCILGLHTTEYQRAPEAGEQARSLRTTQTVSEGVAVECAASETIVRSEVSTPISD